MRRVLGILAIAALLPVPASAHRLSNAYLNIRLGGPAVRGVWDIAVRDLDPVVDVDPDEDRVVTWRELNGARSRIADYALKNLRLSRAGTPAALHLDKLFVHARADGAYAQLEFSGSFPGP